MTQLNASYYAGKHSQLPNSGNYSTTIESGIYNVGRSAKTGKLTTVKGTDGHVSVGTVKGRKKK
jgi:hypothetical protein